MTDLQPDVKMRIKLIIDDMLSQYDLQTCGIEVAEDATGDEAIFVDLRYNLSPREFDPLLMFKVRSAVREMLMENGDYRFPFIRHHLPAGQGVKAA